MTFLGDVIWLRHQNDVIVDILEVLLRHNYFLRPQISLVTQLRINKTQKNQNGSIILQTLFLHKLEGDKII